MPEPFQPLITMPLDVRRRHPVLHSTHAHEFIGGQIIVEVGAFRHIAYALSSSRVPGVDTEDMRTTGIGAIGAVAKGMITDAERQ